MNAYFAELVGTAILILLGNGVVANVVLAKTKGNDSGWIVITFGWGMAVFVAVWCVEAISGGTPESCCDTGLSAGRKIFLEARAGLHGRPNARRDHRGNLRVPVLRRSLRGRE